MARDPDSTPCPTDDTLGALLHHALGPDDRARVTAHVDTCAACRQIMMAAVRAGVAEPAALKIGRYELRALLGMGGMGAVYEAHDRELDRAVALKVLRSELGDVTGLADRLIHESRLMARLAHPAVITIYDVGRDAGAVFIAMELVRGATLGAWLRSRSLDWRAIVALYERAGHGLAAAHAAGIVHRDFKPDNVLVAHDGDKVVVTDFGIAREASQLPVSSELEITQPVLRRTDLQLTTDGALLGTPAYMAPEQIEGRSVSHRADIFAFSVALWEALFGARPFPGATLAEIFSAMHQPPVRPAGTRVPRRLVRALQRGLAREPGDRWRDLPTLLRELVAIRARRKRRALAAAAVGLVGVGIAAALVVARPGPTVDRCMRALAPLDQAYNPQLEASVGAALTGDPAIRSTVLARLGAATTAWRATHLATCHDDRDAIQDGSIAACLDARRIELAGTVDDLIASAPAHAIRLSELIGQPAACATPASGLLFARVPAERELRRKVTALRARLADASDAFDRFDFPRALGDAEQIVAAAAPAWPPVHAEALLTLGKIQSLAGDSKLAIPTLRAAVGAAERAHHDSAAAAAWTQLAMITANDESDPKRALEYIGYAEAAADRVARPAALMARLDYVKGFALMGADRVPQAEAALRDAVALAEPLGGEDLARSLHGLGLFYERQGRNADAATAYRQAIEHLPRSASGQILGEVSYFERLALSLSSLGQLEQAEREGRHAVQLADRTLPVTQIDRPLAHLHLAQILSDAGSYPEALAEIVAAVAGIASIQGIRSKLYGQALNIQADILDNLSRYRDANRLLVRACEIIAFADGDDSADYASCEISHAEVLVHLHRAGEALAEIDRAVASLLKARGASHPETADAFLKRAIIHTELRHRRAAIADFERAIPVLAAAQVESGFVADAHWRLGRELWTDEPARARAEILAGLALFETATPFWASQKAEAVAWLASHDRGKRSR